MTEIKSYKAYLIADGDRYHLLFGIAGVKRFHSQKIQEIWLFMSMRGKICRHLAQTVDKLLNVCYNKLYT